MNWKTEIYDDDGCEAIRTEYRVLLGLKMSDEEAEHTIMQYCLGRITPGTPEEGRLWFALALTQWSYGRLTPTAKENAFYWMQFDQIVSESTLHMLKETLLSSMPKKKTFSIPPWAKSCPWPEGSLLAYRIITDTQHQENYFWGKFVLLRIVEIVQYPITFVAPEAGSIKRMSVALYNWCGDVIPDLSTISNLEFTPIIDCQPVSAPSHLRAIRKDALSPRLEELLGKAIETVEYTNPEHSIQLDWKANDGVFSYLGCDPNFREQTPNYVLNRGQWILSHSNVFDSTLLRRLQELSASGELKCGG